MSNFFDDYLKLNPIEDKPKEKEKAKEDEPNEEESDKDDE